MRGAAAWRVSSVRATSVLVTPPVLEPLTLAEGKLRAGLDWADGDPRDAMMRSCIAAARAKVEHDTALALLTQTRDVFFDGLPGGVIALPPQCRPLQELTSIGYTDSADGEHVVDPASYVVDLPAGRIGLSFGASWPADVRAFQPWHMRIVAGWPAVDLLPAPLLHAVALLTAHYATFGRDMLQIGHIVATTPYGYDDAIAPYQAVSLI